LRKELMVLFYYKKNPESQEVISGLGMSLQNYDKGGGVTMVIVFRAQTNLRSSLFCSINGGYRLVYYGGWFSAPSKAFDGFSKPCLWLLGVDGDLYSGQARGHAQRSCNLGRPNGDCE